MHLFWLALFVPAVVLSQWIWPILKQRSIWSLSAIAVCLLTIVWLAMGLPSLGPSERNFEGILKMLAFRLVASSDLPLVQLLIASSVGWLRSGWSQPDITRIAPSAHEPESPINESLRNLLRE